MSRVRLSPGVYPAAVLVGKLYLFAAAVQNEYYRLAVIGLVMSAVSLFFALAVLVVATLLPGIFPGIFLDAAKGAAAGFI